MAESKRKQPEMEKIKEVEKTLRKAFGDPQIGLRTLKDLQVIQRAIFLQESRRLEKKLGATHPRVLNIKARLGQNRDLIQDLEVERQKASIRMPKAEAKEAVISGRIVTPAKLGVRYANVALEGSTGRAIANLGQATTDTAGFYAIKVDEATIARLIKTEKQDVYLSVRDPKGNVIQRESEPVTIEEGARVYREVRVDSVHPGTFAKSPRMKSQFQPTPRKKKKPKKQPKKDDAPWIVRGSVVDAAGNAVQGVLVRLFDKDRLYDDLLGATQTDKKGQFEITYRLQDFREGLEPGADLYLTVTDAEGDVLYSSKDAIRFDAGREEEFDIQLSGEDDSKPVNQ